ncbi:hypothetical protein V6N13_062870 [Hibiscus sabdariffa]
MAGKIKGIYKGFKSISQMFGTDDQSIRSEPRMKKLRNRSCTDLSNATEKRKRRRKSTSTSESSSTKSRRLSKTKTTSTQLDSSSDYEI